MRLHKLKANWVQYSEGINYNGTKATYGWNDILFKFTIEQNRIEHNQWMNEHFNINLRPAILTVEQITNAGKVVKNKCKWQTINISNVNKK